MGQAKIKERKIRDIVRMMICLGEDKGEEVVSSVFLSSSTQSIMNGRYVL
jgi:hypothetical protein